ncbi:MAG: acyl-CoA reductase [Flavobacteriaceae bacterium]|nr:acyl-CoA reductase [Flavobacteriaceae bacterium]
MNLEQRIAAFSKLGSFMRQFAEIKAVRDPGVPSNDLFFDGMKHQLQLAGENNSWFTRDNLAYAFRSWSELLTKESLQQWFEAYDTGAVNSKQVGIIMAGNIPLVGFHDFLSVLVSGHEVLVKQATKDRHLLPYLAKYLKQVEPGFESKISFTDERMSGFDAIIATGSNNTARYFEYYFKDVPSIIRHNRNSAAILKGDESQEQLAGLAEDIFRYFGLGCRSVSKLFVPSAYDFKDFFMAVYPWRTVIDFQKYSNNYDYNKAVYLMSEFDILDNGFLMLKEDSSYASPIATVFYERYNSSSELMAKLKFDSQNIQCVVADGLSDSEVAFGQTQRPALNDYADGIDTVDFLLKI